MRLDPSINNLCEEKNKLVTMSHYTIVQLTRNNLSKTIYLEAYEVTMKTTNTCACVRACVRTYVRACNVYLGPVISELGMLLNVRLISNYICYDDGGWH